MEEEIDEIVSSLDEKDDEESEEQKEEERISYPCLIRLQRIYNFLLFHALYYLFWMFNGLYYTLLYYFWD